MKLFLAFARTSMLILSTETPGIVHRINLVTKDKSAELQALLDLHAARTFKNFWQSARRVLHSALPVAATWFAPASDWLPPCAAFRAEMRFKSDREFQRFQELHPLKAFLRANPHKLLATFSDVLSDARLLKSRFYREFMAPQHRRFSVVFAFWQQTLLRALIGLNRLENDRDFSRAELQTLGELHRYVSANLQRVYELQRERSARCALELLLSPLPLSIAVLDWNLNVVYSNEAAKQSAALWIAKSEHPRCLKKLSRFEIPGEVRELCGELKKAWSPPDERHRRSSRNGIVTVGHRPFAGLQVSVRLLELSPQGVGMPLFVVVFENMRGLANLSLLEAGRLSQFARLSVREREVASLVCAGQSNKEVASDLGKSVLTVKAQLRTVYRKLGIAGRGRLIARLQQQ
jgi:DNA-binding CsgD family transcriptional regulator